MSDVLVRARFDGSNFNNNIEKSRSALTKFKESTNFEEQTAKASRFASVFTKEIGGMQNSLNSFNTSKFNLSINSIGDGLIGSFDKIKIAIEDRLNDVANTVRTIWNGIMTEPIHTGFQEYETQINAIQTILANTQSAGTTINDVTRALDELNLYADKTIYNFTEMTRNIGTFTAAGVDLETSTQAIKGIANLGAISGSNSEQVSRAMYQLSQALAAGKVNLQDWNSVVNAGMGGKVFQDALVETARKMGVVVDISEGFRNSLSAKTSDSWLTSDVLLETLKTFADETTELGKLGTEAATKVKTITQLWDTIKESVQSGWTRSWEYIVGDFDEAKGLLSAISDKVNELLNPMAEYRNGLLEYWATVKDAGKEATVGVEEAIKASDEIERLAEEVIRGDWSNGQERKDLLSQAGYDYATIQHRVDEILGIVTSGNEAINSSIEGGQTGREMMLEGLKNISNFLIKIFDTAKSAYRELFPALTGEQLTDFSRKFRDLTKVLELSEKQWSNIHDAFIGVFSIIKIGKTAVKQLGFTFRSALNVINVSDLKDSLFELLHIDKDATLLGVLRDVGLSIKDISEVFESDENIKNWFKELGETIGYSVNYILEFVTAMVDFMNLPAEVKLEAIKDGFSHSEERIHKLVEIIKDAVSLIKKLIGSLYHYILDKLGIDAPVVESKWIQVIDKLKSILDNFLDIPAVSWAKNKLLTGIEYLATKLGVDAEKVKKAYDKLGLTVSEATTQPSLTNKETSQQSAIDIGGTTTVVSEYISKWNDIKTKVINVITDVINSIAGILNTIFSALMAKEGFLLLHNLRKFVGSLNEIAESMGDGIDAITDSLDSFTSVMKSLSFGINAAAILTIAIAIGILAGSLKLISTIDSSKIEDATMAIIWLFTGLISSLSTAGKVGKVLKSGYVSTLAISIATSVLLMVGALSLINKLDKSEIDKSIGILAVIVVYFKIILASMKNLVSSAGENVKSFMGLGSILTSLALALTMMIAPIWILSLIPADDLKEGLRAIEELTLILALFIMAISVPLVNVNNGGNSNFVKSILSISGMLMMLSAAISMLVIPISILSLIAIKNSDGIWTGVLAISAIIGVITVMLALIAFAIKPLTRDNQSLPKLTKLILSIAFIFMSISASLLLLLPSIAIIQGLVLYNWDALKSGLWILAGMLVALTAAMIVIIKALSNKKARKIDKSVLATLTVSMLSLMGGIAAMLLAIQPILKYDPLVIISALGGVALVIASMALLIKILGGVKKVSKLAFATLAFMIVGIDVMLLSLGNLNKKQIKLAIIVITFITVLLAAMVALNAIFNKSQNISNSVVTNNYNQINKVVQIVLAVSAALAGIGILLVGFKSFVDATINAADAGGDDIFEGLSAIATGIIKAAPIITAALFELIVAVGTIFQMLPYASWAATFYAKFMMVIQVIMTLMNTGPLIPQVVTFILQTLVNIIYLVVGFADSIAELVVVLIIAIINGVGRALQVHGAELGESIANILKGLASLVGALFISIFGEEMASSVLTALAIAAIAVIMGVPGWAALLIGGLVFAVSQIFNAITKKMDEDGKMFMAVVFSIFVLVAAFIALGLTTGIGAAPIILIGAIAFLVSYLIVKFCELLGIASPSKVFIEFGVFIVKGLAKGIVNAITFVGKALWDIWYSIAEWLVENTLIDDAIEYGINLIEGLIDGIKEKASGIWKALKEAAGSAFDKFCDFFKIASPSKLMKQMGVYIDQGLADGIASESDTVSDAMAELQNGTDSIISEDIAKKNGQSFVQSLTSGILDKKDDLTKTTKEISSSLENGLPTVDVNNIFGEYETPNVDLSNTPDITELGEIKYDVSTIGTLEKGPDNIERDIENINDLFSDFSITENKFDLGGMQGAIKDSLGSGENIGEQYGLDLSSGLSSGFNISSIFGSDTTSNGVMDSIKNLTGSVKDVFSNSGEDSGNSFLSGLTNSGESGGLISGITGIFGNSGEQSGESFTNGIVSGINSKDLTSSISGLFDNATSEAEVSATVTPVLAMGDGSELGSDISAQVQAGTVDVSNDARVGIETSGIGERIDASVLLSQKIRGDLVELNNKISFIKDKITSIQRQNETIRDNSSEILNNMGYDVYLDSGTLVGSIGPIMDKYLGIAATRQSRTNSGRVYGPTRSPLFK